MKTTDTVIVFHSFLVVWFILQRSTWTTVDSRLIEVEYWWEGKLTGRAHWSARSKTPPYATLPTANPTNHTRAPAWWEADG